VKVYPDVFISIILFHLPRSHVTAGQPSNTVSSAEILSTAREHRYVANILLYPIGRRGLLLENGDEKGDSDQYLVSIEVNASKIAGSTLSQKQAEIPTNTSECRCPLVL
jgi:hypothetical protein